MSPAAYVDTSAFVKLVVREPESAALRRFLRRWSIRAACALIRTEAVRAVRPQGPAAVDRARAALRAIDLIAVDVRLLDAAAALDPPSLRSLDAIHLAAALALGDELGIVVTYDMRLAEGATAVGLRVASPG